MATVPEAKPTVEALEAERQRLKELERNLAAERNRIQQAAEREIARMQVALREAADRAGKREQELERTQRKLDRTAKGGRLAAFGLAGRTAAERDESVVEREARAKERERELAARTAELEREAARLQELESSLAESRSGMEQAEALAAQASLLEDRKADLDRQVDELVEAERRSAGLLAARTVELEARSAEVEARASEVEARAVELEERATALDVQGAELRTRREAFEAERQRAPEPEMPAVPVIVEEDLRAEQERLEAKARTLDEAEQRFAESRAEAVAREGTLRSREHELRVTEDASAVERAALDARAAQVAGAELRAAEVEDRGTLLDAREAELRDSAAALERREAELTARRAELESARRRLAERARKLSEAERRAPVHRSSAPPVTFGEGLRALSRRDTG